MLTDSPAGNQGHMKIAAIDLGSNSLHMVVVEASGSGGFRVIGREKEMVRLGARTLARRPALRSGHEAGAGGPRASTSAWRETQGVGQAPRRRHLRRARGRQRRGLPGARGPRARHLAARHLRRRGGAPHLPGRAAQHPPRGPARAGGRHRRRQRRAGARRGQAPRAAASREARRAAHGRGVRARATPCPPRTRTRLVQHVGADRWPSRVRVSARRRSTSWSGRRAPSWPWAPWPSARRRRHVARHPAPRDRAGRGDPRRRASRLAATDLRDAPARCRASTSRGPTSSWPGAVVLDTHPAAARASRSWCSASGRCARGSCSTTSTGHPRSLARAEAYPDVRRRSVVSLAERCAATTRSTRATWPQLAAGPVRRHAPAARPGRRRSARCSSTRRCCTTSATTSPTRATTSTPTTSSRTATCAASRPSRSRSSPTSPATTAAAIRAGSTPASAALPARRRGARCGCWPALLRLADALDRSHRQVVQRPGRRAAAATLLVQRATPTGDTRARAVGRPAAGRAAGARCSGVPVEGARSPAAPASRGRRAARATAAARGRRSPDGRPQAHAAAAGTPPPAVPRPRRPPRPDRGRGHGRERDPAGGGGGRRPASPLRILEEVSRGVLLGKDTFTHGRLGARHHRGHAQGAGGLPPHHGHLRRACATARWPPAPCARPRTATPSSTACACAPASTWRSSTARRRTGSPTWPCASRCATIRRCVAGDALLVEVGGGSADISFLRKGQPIHSGHLSRWAPSACARAWPPGTAATSRACACCGGTSTTSWTTSGARCRCARRGTSSPWAATCASPAAQIAGRRAPTRRPARARRASAFVAFCDQIVAYDVEQLVEHYRLPQSEAETLVPALLAYRELLLETAAEQVTVPDASLRAGPAPRPRRRRGPARASRTSAARCWPARPRWARSTATTPPTRARWPQLAVRLFDELRAEHGLADRDRLLLEVAALLHDVGNYVNLRGHHKHTQYLLSVSEIFGPLAGRHGGRRQRGPLPPPRPAPEVAPALHGPRPRGARRRQQAVRDPAPGQRPRRRPPAEGEGRARAARGGRAGCWRWRGRAT